MKNDEIHGGANLIVLDDLTRCSLTLILIWSSFLLMIKSVSSQVGVYNDTPTIINVVGSLIIIGSSADGSSI